MTINMLIFDFRENEKKFFNGKEIPYFKFTFFTQSLTPETVRELPQDLKDETTVISVFTSSNVTQEVINEFKNLRIISTRSTAYDHICKKAATDRNIAVINVTNYGKSSVAQFTFCLIFALIRKLIPAVQEGQTSFNPNELMGHDISKLSIGVVGTGIIGASVCKIAHAFNMKIYGFDVKMRQELINAFNIEYLSLNELLKISDIITLHIPYTGDNLQMFSKNEFNLMKQSAYFVNTSSKKLVNLESLYETVADGKIAGAALDTECCEGLVQKCYENSELFSVCTQENKFLNLLSKLPNVIVTPHLAYNTEEAVEYILQNTIDQIKNCIKGGNVYGIF